MKDIDNLPLVSVLCRSMNRPELPEALQSVNQQTYSHMEIVLVDATGKGLDQHKGLANRFPVLEVSTNHQLSRPAAANKALERANGSYLMFLDEDDWIDPEHIQQLVAVLEENPNIGVVYSSTQKVRSSGEASAGSLRISYDPARLRRDNFIPIHSAIFRASLLSDDVRFDESLEVFEDWDFWLQLAARTDFLHLDVMTAFYREGGGSNTASDDPTTRYQSGHPIAVARERVFDKWLPKWTGHELNQTLSSLDDMPLIQSLREDSERLNADLQARADEINTLNHSTSKLNQALIRRNAELQDARAHSEHLVSYIDMLQSSTSWRVTKPLRWIRRRLDELRPTPVDNQAQSPHAATEDNTPSEGESVIKGNLDIPSAKQSEFAEQLTLQGWCCSPNGIERIDAFVNGALRSSFATGISRPDIAELFPDFPDVFSAGFYQDLELPDLPAGEHALELRFIDKANHVMRITRQFVIYKNNDLYNSWYFRNLPSDIDLAQLRSAANATNPASRPDFDVLITSAGSEADLLTTLSSLSEQVWPSWTLHIQGVPNRNIENFIQHNFLDAQRVHWHTTLRDALAVLANNDTWTAILKPGETIAPHTLREFAQLAQNQGQDLQLIYSDHDKLSSTGEHTEPTFTPQWSPEHLMSSNYVGGFFAFRSSCLQTRQFLDLESSAWRYALLLMIAEATQEKPGSVQRIAKVLWSEPEISTPSALLPDEVAALRSHLSRTHPNATVLEQDNNTRAVLWPLSATPKVSIVIPTMGKLDLIKPCIDSLIEKTTYPNFEVLMLDNSRGKFPDGIDYLKGLQLNDRQLTVIECNEPFNWARLNNTGVRHTSGELLLFLNDDIEVTSSDWLEHLVRQALRPQVGAVGALLYYPNGALQHTGVLLVNYGGGAIHLLHKRMPSKQIYRNLHQTVREVSANTGACLMVSREKFDAIGGFDEELSVVGNDVDFCLRLREQGYRNIWTPLCHLIHHESISRKSSVPKDNEKAMWQRWAKRFMAGDEYYNPNLSLAKADFTLEVNYSPLPTTTANGSAPAAREPLQRGVNLIGYTRAEMGIGEGARSDARALDAAKEPFGIISFSSGNPSRMTDLSWQHKEIDTAPYDITLLHINPDHAIQAITELPSSHFDGRYCIGYWAWELPEIPAEWEKSFKYFDEIWVPSNFVQNAVAMKSPVPVVTIPHSIEVTTDDSLTRASLDLPENAFLFLVMFDTYSRQERKNPYGAIEAFRNAFAPDDMSARLVIKVNNATPDAMRALREKIGSHQNIFMLDKVYSRTEVNGLIANCDCFVSLHRSEGFGLGPAEAMALGKAIMATNWSGNTDYMRPDNSIGINYRLVTIEQDYGPYKKGQVWAEPDLEQAAQAMRELASNKELAERLGRNAKKSIESMFSPAAVGTMMQKRLTAIREMQARLNGL